MKEVTGYMNETGQGVALPKGKEMKEVCIFASSDITSDAVGVMIASLQGLTAKSSEKKIYINEGGAGTNWIEHIIAEYQVEKGKTYSDYKSLLADFDEYFRGYILCDISGNPESLNAASAISGNSYGIIVDKSLEEEVKELGLEMIMDISDKDEAWVYENMQEYYSQDYMSELNPSIYYHLRDYISMTSQYTFHGAIDDRREMIMSNLNPQATLFGYGEDEFEMIRQASEQGVTSIPSDLAPNLSVLSSIYPEGNIMQHTDVQEIEAEEKHHVCFIISDGDNVAFNLWSMYEYFNSDARGTFSVGFGISPSLYDLAPSAMQWYYDNANIGEVKEEFVAGPSGTGYVFPSRMTDEDLEHYVERLNIYMEKADLRITQVLDQGAQEDIEGWERVWEKFLEQPNIDAAFYFGYGETTNGDIRWYHDKPVILQSNVLWEGLTEEVELIEYLNQAKADPTSQEGYSLILVHCWTKSMEDIRTVVEGLQEHVKVVAPKEFVSLISKNVIR